MIKAIIFDMDNTLINRQKAFISMLKTELPKIVGNDPRLNNMISDIIAWDNKGQMERIDSFGLWVDKYQITQITAKEFADQWSAQSGSVAYLFDDVRDTLAQLKQRYKIGVLSNGDTVSQRRKLQTIAIYDLLDYSLISSEFGVRKPDPSIFCYTAQQMGVNVDECVYVGDSYRIDIEGSINAGMHAVYVDRNGHNTYPVTTIHEISQLLDLY